MARAGTVLLDRAELMIPVPLHRRRLFHRRYNQALLLANEVSRLSGVPVIADALARVRSTAPLGSKSPAERAVEVANVFRVRTRRVPALIGRRVLLIDDVMTSGATANACAAVLLGAGVAGIDVLVAARVPDPRLN
jgi:ComF family protein